MQRVGNHFCTHSQDLISPTIPTGDALLRHISYSITANSVLLPNKMGASQTSNLLGSCSPIQVLFLRINDIVSQGQTAQQLPAGTERQAGAQQEQTVT